MKYKITIKSSFIQTVTKTIEANDKSEANIVALSNIKDNDWKIEDKLVSVIKRLF